MLAKQQKLIHQLCTDTGYCLEDSPRGLTYRDDAMILCAEEFGDESVNSRVFCALSMDLRIYQLFLLEGLIPPPKKGCILGMTLTCNQ